MKIFVLGMGKCGSVSVYQALSHLGIQALHYYPLCQRIADDFDQGLLHPKLDEFDAFIDGPFHLVIPQIDALMGEDQVRYIYLPRDKESWIQSRIIHCLYNRIFGDANQERLQEIDTCRWAEMHDRFCEISETFPDDRTLTLNLKTSDPWDQLTRFLEITPQDSWPPFPQSNSSSERLRQIAANKWIHTAGRHDLLVD